MAAPIGNKFAEGNEGGRPTSYKPEYCDQVFKLCLLGATDKEMATFFEVSEVTFNNWKAEHEEFLMSIKEGKITADANVARSLYKRATGFEYDEVSWEKVDANVVNETGDLVKQDAYKKKVTTKIVPPDVAAANIWLKNRRGKAKVDQGAQHWADKQETGFTDSEGNDLENLPISFK